MDEIGRMSLFFSQRGSNCSSARGGVAAEGTVDGAKKRNKTRKRSADPYRECLRKLWKILLFLLFFFSPGPATY